MTVHALEAVEFQDPAAGGPGPDPASVCVALARAETSLAFPAAGTPAGPYCFSIFLRQRRLPVPVTLVIGDAEGDSVVTAELTGEWVRHDVMRDSKVGDIAARIFLGEPGCEVPILSDCLFTYPQLENARFPSSPIGPRPARQLWALYDNAEAALSARAASDEVAGAPFVRAGRRIITSGVVLRHPTAALFGVPATRTLREAVFTRRSASQPIAVRTIGPDWAGAVPLPLSAAATRDASDLFAVPAIVGPDGRPLAISSPELIRTDSDMRELVRALEKQPQDLQSLSPRVFEALIAHLLERDGYEVKLQPKSGRGHPDHGIDILAIRKPGLGQFVMGVQCKRYGNGNKVSGEMVRSLMGALAWNGLERGVLVTTSEFQPQAFEYEAGVSRRVSLELDLVDYHDIMRWLKLYG